MTGIADKGFLVAFANRRDHHHAWALDVASRIDARLLTCDAVLAETAFHLQSASLVIATARDGLVEARFVLAEHTSRLAELADRYSDRNPDVADLCLIRLSELNPRLPGYNHRRTRFPGIPEGRREVYPVTLPCPKLAPLPLPTLRKKSP